MQPIIAPYGSWRSPITAELLATAGVSLSYPQPVGDTLYWLEGRPLEKGRYVIVHKSATGQVRDVTPPDFAARTLVHEYGGGAYFVHEQTVFFANFSDQRLYCQQMNSDGRASVPRPITPEPPQPRSLRYADLRVTPDGKWLFAVREQHLPGNFPGEGDHPIVINELVMLPTDGSIEPQVVTGGYDFYSNPRVSPDGRQLAWLCWQNPQMPWDGVELWVAELDKYMQLRRPRRVAGSSTESLYQPEWSPDGVLHFVSDRTNWWNLYRELDGRIQPVAPIAAELGQPQWVFDQSRYAFLQDGTIACIYTQNGLDFLGLIAPGSQVISPLATDFTMLNYLRTDGQHLWLVAGSATHGSTVVSLEPHSGQVTVIKRDTLVTIDPAYFAAPQPIEFPTEDPAGRAMTAHAIYYAPSNPHYRAPAGELPLLVVTCHGGPTGAARTQLSLAVQYWTSRGIGLVDVNYGGSTGYGRAYRQRLNNNWGLVDVIDCINAAKYLIAQGQADPQRVAIRGGSAGGYTTLRALTWQNFFKAGAAYYPLAELEVFTKDTHKFEARYLDNLVGPYPAARQSYFDRSPVNFVDNLSTPVILFQGLEDKIVPPSQPEIMVAALAKKKLPHAYLAFAGEQHGFRKAETIIRCAEAELYFYGKIFNFDPADEIEPVVIENL